MSNPLQTFQDILTDKGLIPSEIMADGKLHCCPTQAKPHKQNGAYIAHCDALPHCGGATGKAENRAHVPRPRKDRSPRLKERRYRSVKTPYGGSVRRNVPNGVKRRRDRRKTL